MDNVYLIYYITEDSKQWVSHLGPCQNGGQKIAYSKDKKLVFFTFIFALLIPDGGRVGGGEGW